MNGSSGNSRGWKNMEALFPLRGRWLRYLLSPVACLFGLWLVSALPYVADVPVHNWNLWRWSRAFARLPHPTGSWKIETWADLGNHSPLCCQCDYRVVEERGYAGSRHEIEQFYQHAAVRNPRNGRGEPLQLQFSHDLPNEYVVMIEESSPQGRDYRCMDPVPVYLLPLELLDRFLRRW